MSVGALTESGDTVTASVTTNGTFTARGTFTPTGGTGEDLADSDITITANSVSVGIDAGMRATGGTISITVTSIEDETVTDTVTYDVAKVYTINLGDLSRTGDIVSGTVTTNNTTFTTTATLGSVDVDASAITTTLSGVEVDVTGLGTGELSVTVTCDTDPTKSATKTFTLS